MTEYFDYLSCCVFTCCLKTVGAIKDRDDGSGLMKIDHTGLIYSFLLSVGNDTRWKPVLKESTKKCNEQYDGAGEGKLIFF